MHNKSAPIPSHEALTVAVNDLRRAASDLIWGGLPPRKKFSPVPPKCWKDVLGRHTRRPGSPYQGTGMAFHIRGKGARCGQTAKGLI